MIKSFVISYMILELGLSYETALAIVNLRHCYRKGIQRKAYAVAMDAWRATRQ